jgi:hypothetical protein
MVNIGQRCQTIYVKTYVSFNVSGVITSPHSTLFYSNGTRMFVRPSVPVAISAFISATPTGRIYVNVILDMCTKNLSRNSTFG